MRNSFVCPICKKSRSEEKYHCRDHCMDMCRDHVRESGEGRYHCTDCGKDVFRFRYDGARWVQT